MKQWLKKRKGRGFTLVELLIVIVIIGILAGSLLLVMGSGTDKANATKLVSDMRTIKAAALMYYADQGEWPSAVDDTTANGGLKDYLDRVPTDLLGEFSIISNDEGVYFIQVDLSAATTNSEGYQAIVKADPFPDEMGVVVSGDIITARIGK